jgi:hypothetical protein
MRDCYVLYDLKDKTESYEKAVLNLEKTVVDLNLNNLIDPLELSFMLRFHTYPFPESVDQFKKFVDKLLKFRNVSFYFHIADLIGFPNDHIIGHGKLKNFDTLSASVKKYSQNLVKDQVGEVKTEQERIQTTFLRQIPITMPCRILA